MFLWRAWTRGKEEVFQFTTILISLITKDYEAESIEKTYDSCRGPKAWWEGRRLVSSTLPSEACPQAFGPWAGG